MWSASRRTSRRSLVASPPTILIARPGPGNGWRRAEALGAGAKLRADGPDLVLEQRSQWLDELELSGRRAARRRLW